MILSYPSLSNFYTRVSRVLLFWCFMFFLTSLFSQSSMQERRLYMSQMGANEGLSSGSINSIAEDHNGYLWFGTTDGLNRFDGYRIKKYINQSGNINSLISNYINKIYVDSRGWIWILTRSNGLHLYNRKNDNFLRLPQKRALMNFFEDQNGDIWCLTDKGYDIIQLNEGFQDDTSFPVSIEDITIRADKEVYPNLPAEIVNNKITFSGSSGLWVHKSDTLYNFSINKKKESIHLDFKMATGQTKNVQLFHNPVKNQIVILGETKLLVFDITNKKFQDSIELPAELGKSKNIQLIDYKNRVWLLAEDVFCRVNLDTNNWEIITLQREGARKNQLKYAGSTIQDSHKNIWIGTKGLGVFKHSDNNEFFNYYGFDRGGPFVHVIRDYGDNSVIFSETNEKSTFKVLDYKTNTLEDVVLSEEVFSPIVPSSFNVFFKDSKQRYWLPSRQVNSDGYKMLVLDKNLKIIDEIESPFDTENNKNTLVTYVFETEDGQVWGVGSVKSGNEIQEYPHVYLSKYSEEKKQFLIESVFKDHQQGFVFGQCITSIQTADDSIWLGFEIGGMLKYTLGSKEWKHLLKGDALDHKTAFSVLSSHESLSNPDTNFWVGTRSGLIDFNYSDETYTKYDETDGLIDPVIYGILSDEKSNLWLSTNNGISMFNSTSRKVVTSFNEDDGIQGAEFNRWAYLKKDDGTLFFGGVGGLTWFNPQNFEVKSDNSQIEITGLKLNNVSADSLLVANTKIELPYDQKQITFEFAKLNLTSSHRNHYVYKLEKDSNSEEWIDLGTQASITFTELARGNYEFFISTHDINGNISNEFSSLMFSIEKPWWCNHWFKFFGFLVIAGICYYVYIVKIRSKRKLEKLKNRISRDLHDEIGSTLSSIAMYGTIAEKEIISDPEKARNLIQKINLYAINSIEKMNDIIWTIKSGNEKLEELLKRMRYYFTELEETGDWKTSIEHEDHLLDCTFDAIKIRNLFLIIKESVANAVKHSQGNSIVVRLSQYSGDNMIVIEIEDNGVGFDINSIDIGRSNGLVNMQKRANELDGLLEYIVLQEKGFKVKLSFNHTC